MMDVHMHRTSWLVLVFAGALREHRGASKAACKTGLLTWAVRVCILVLHKAERLHSSTHVCVMAARCECCHAQQGLGSSL
jgi:hypothetical protein